jgi:hypothetical protein
VAGDRCEPIEGDQTAGAAGAAWVGPGAAGPRRWLDQLARAADDGTFLWATTGFAVAATTPASTS